MVNRRGIGRIELAIVVLLVLGLLATLPPWLLQRRDKSRRQQSTYQLRKIGLAASTYQEIYRSLPPGGGNPGKVRK
ncbi:MAG: DUF1559 domain-containing protein [Planctomycetaceae bacterium]